MAAVPSPPLRDGEIAVQDIVIGMKVRIEFDDQLVETSGIIGKVTEITKYNNDTVARLRIGTDDPLFVIAGVPNVHVYPVPETAPAAEDQAPVGGRSRRRKQTRRRRVVRRLIRTRSARLRR